jgi:hypothetical protein
MHKPGTHGVSSRVRACRVQGLSYAALACFGIEYITLFMGVSIFLRPLNLLNILAHGVGLILTILLYVDVSTRATQGAAQASICSHSCLLISPLLHLPCRTGT